MKHITRSLGYSVGALALIIGVGATPAHAISASSALNAYTTEKTQLQTTQADIKASIGAFKQNLAKIKTSTAAQKQQFAVDVYAKANTFFTTEHDQFMVALNSASSQGVDVSEARAHFDKAWQLILQANADAKSLADINISDTTKAQAKTYAQHAEAGYIQVRNELHAGAIALKVAIQAHFHTSVTPTSGSVSASAGASVSAQ